MIQQTVLPFKLEMTDEVLTPRAGLALIAEYMHGLGLHRDLEQELPRPGSGRGRQGAGYGEPIILMHPGGGRRIEDLRILERDKGLKKLLRYEVPSVSATGDWLRRMGDPAKGAKGLRGLEHTKEAFRLIVIKERELQLNLWGDKPKERHHAVATNLAEKWAPEEVMEWHNGRGNAENYIKESKIGFGLETLPCGRVPSGRYANAVWYRLASIAYNVLIGFKRLCCPPEWMYYTVATFRWRLFETAARVVKHGRRVILKIAGGWGSYTLFREIRENIFALYKPG
ncbi:MAG: hypothetical protein A3G93_13015 [Nitrospinae bacterium RIFCSPLOWO2_12_FULL_45_22]|nr:MAG: hypothetical protein A3G93_13015 [Nitrospinae bacterium RIFCSPLOWO2_12_FULL_45_22]